MPVGSHQCVRGLGVLHPKPFEKILSVLRLGDESVVLKLLHLESKEVGQLAHHRHLELLSHHQLWQNLPSYWAHMHLTLSQRPQTTMHVHQITLTGSV